MDREPSHPVEQHPGVAGLVEHADRRALTELGHHAGFAGRRRERLDVRGGDHGRSRRGRARPRHDTGRDPGDERPAGRAAEGTGRSRWRAARGRRRRTIAMEGQAELSPEGTHTYKASNVSRIPQRRIGLGGEAQRIVHVCGVVQLPAPPPPCLRHAERSRRGSAPAFARRIGHAPRRHDPRLADVHPRGAPLTARIDLHVRKPRYFLGENALIDFCVVNPTEAPIQIDVGGDYRGSSRSLRFKVEVRDAAGNQLADPDLTPFNLVGSAIRHRSSRPSGGASRCRCGVMRASTRRASTRFARRTISAGPRVRRRPVARRSSS